MDGNLLFVTTTAALGLLGLLDRMVLRRGKVEITKLEPAGQDGEYLRFALTYQATSEPEWSELSYHFRDKKCPTTVIAGKTRSISGCTAGTNSEYLLIRSDLLVPGEWELRVKILTTSRRNPFYSLFPFMATSAIPVQVNANV